MKQKSGFSVRHEKLRSAALKTRNVKMENSSFFHLVSVPLHLMSLPLHLISLPLQPSSEKKCNDQNMVSEKMQCYVKRQQNLYWNKTTKNFLWQHSSSQAWQKAPLKPPCAGVLIGAGAGSAQSGEPAAPAKSPTKLAWTQFLSITAASHGAH